MMTTRTERIPPKTGGDLPSDLNLLCCVICLVLVLLLAGCATSGQNRMILYGGDIVTMSNTPSGDVEAVFVEDGRIVSMGSRDTIFKHKTDATRLIDLKGNTLMPGFIGVHTHPDLAAYLYNFVDLSGFTNRTADEVWAKLRQAVKETKKGQWIFCKGFDPMLIKGLTAPNITYLDSIAPDNPLFILAQSMHSAWANSLAFKKIGITGKTPDPAPGNYYEKDSRGELTGFIAEIEALKPFALEAVKAFNIKNNVVKVFDDYPGNGITSITTMGLVATDRKPLLLYEHLSTHHPKFIHNALALFGILPDRKPTVRHFLYIKHDTPFLFPDTVENGDDFFKVCGVKLWYDGSPYTGSMYLKESYVNSELMSKGLKIPCNHSGKAVIDKQEFYSIVKKYHELGWQVSVHSQGDRSTEEVLDVFERIQSESSVKNSRHRIEHGLLLPPELLEKMKRLNVTPSFHINHLYYYGSALKNDILGAERTARMLPVNSVRKNGLYYSLHADAPMYPEEPLSLLQTAVTRKTREGEIIGPHEAISVMDGLRALTVYAAWQLNMEEKIGSIEPGKYADLIILDKNPLKVAPDSLRDIRVLNTFVNGSEVWSRQEHRE
ncbi:MAG: amidohydrolase [Syntrophales bacterium]|nr:amidohydrolase [Syntrophales bacterium]